MKKRQFNLNITWVIGLPFCARYTEMAGQTDAHIMPFRVWMISSRTFSAVGYTGLDYFLNKYKTFFKKMYGKI